MKALLGTELRRLLTRRLARGLAVAAVVAAIGAGTAVFFTSHADTPEHIRSLEARRKAAIERCIVSGFNPPLSAIAADDRREFCVSEGIPAPPFTFRMIQIRDVLEGVDFKGSAAAFVILAFLLGASFVGAEWQSGGIAGLLGWEPARLRVLAAKLLISALVAFVGVLVAQALLAAALVPAALVRGTGEGADGRWVLSTVGAGVRVAAVSALATIVGGSLAMIGRSTAAALGVGFAYALAEVFIRGFENPVWQRWLVGQNAGIFVTAAAPGPSHAAFSPQVALALLAVLAAAICVAAGASFVRKDVA